MINFNIPQTTTATKSKCTYFVDVIYNEEIKMLRSEHFVISNLEFYWKTILLEHKILINRFIILFRRIFCFSILLLWNLSCYFFLINILAHLFFFRKFYVIILDKAFFFNEIFLVPYILYEYTKWLTFEVRRKHYACGLRSKLISS